MIKNAFYFIRKGLFVLNIFKFLSCFFWACRKNSLIRKISFISIKLYDVTTWLTNNYDTHIIQYFTK